MGETKWRLLTQVRILLDPVLPLLQFCALGVRKKRVTGKRDELATYEKYYLLYYSYLAYDYCRTKPRPFTRIYEQRPQNSRVTNIVRMRKLRRVHEGHRHGNAQ